MRRKPDLKPEDKRQFLWDAIPMVARSYVIVF